MKPAFPAFLLATAAIVAPLHAQQPDANAMIRGIRLSATLQQMDLNGVIQKDGQGDVPVSLFVRENNMQFHLSDKDRFHIRMGDESAKLMTVTDEKGTTKDFPANKLTQKIAGTDVTYEDLTLRFLYWPNAHLEGEETIRGEDCYRVRINNPGKEGAFGVVYVWVHKKYGAFWQIRAHDFKGKALKEFQVNEVMKLPDGKGYTIKEMLVNTLTPDLRVASKTYLRFSKPQGGAKEFKRR